MRIMTALLQYERAVMILSAFMTGAISFSSFSPQGNVVLWSSLFTVVHTV
jgi:hypothetical protein